MRCIELKGQGDATCVAFDWLGSEVGVEREGVPGSCGRGLVNGGSLKAGEEEGHAMDAAQGSLCGLEAKSSSPQWSSSALRAACSLSESRQWGLGRMVGGSCWRSCS